MKSSDLREFSGWHKWGREAVQEAPDRPGVYVFRLAGKSFGRFRGESNVVYIGCSADGTVRSRLRIHLSDRADALDIARRLRDPKMGEFQVAWKILTTSQGAKDEEARLLRRYYLDHLELPPDNRSEPAKEIREAIEVLFEQIQRHYPSASPEEVREFAEKQVESFIEKRGSGL